MKGGTSFTREDENKGLIIFILQEQGSYLKIKTHKFYYGATYHNFLYLYKENLFIR